MALLQFGTNSSARLELADGAVPDEYGMPRGEPLPDPGASLTAALENPIDYPTLAASTTPSDKIVLVVDRYVPQLAQITGAMVDCLVAAGIDPDGITVLLSPTRFNADQDDPCHAIAASVRDRIAVVTHEPSDRRQLAYLAASDAGEPILVNRTLHEADVVLPVGCLRDDRTAGYFGVHDAIFPTFSDTKTLQRFRPLGSLAADQAVKRGLVKEVEHVAWLLGINFTVQVVPAGGDQVLHILAGKSDSVARRGRSLYADAWAMTPARRAALVVAAITGDARQQTWENLGRAVEAAASLLEEGGAIAVCCELSDRPGPGVQRMACTESRSQALRQIGKERPVDAIPAAQIARALDRNPLYLLSRLDPATVEDIGMVPLADAHELTRLTHRFPSCAVLANAPYASVRMEADV